MRHISFALTTAQVRDLGMGSPIAPSGARRPDYSGCQKFGSTTEYAPDRSPR